MWQNCQAVAAAIFGDKDQTGNSIGQFSQMRFTALASGESDLLSRTATWTMSRDTQLGLDFSATQFLRRPGFHGSQRQWHHQRAWNLKGAKVCVLTGTTTELNLADYSRANNLNISAVTFEDFNVRDETYLNGGCDSTTGDKSSMAGNLAAFPVPCRPYHSA